MMESERKAEQTESPEPEAGEEQPEEAAEATSPIVEENEIPTIEGEEIDPLLQLEAEVSELKDQLLRQKAETENVRRRLQRDKDEALKHAGAPLLKDLLAVADNLERAIGSLPETAAGSEGPIAQLAAGLELTHKELANVLQRHGVTRIDPQGERLDPHSHEAMFEIEDPSVPAGTVIQVVEAGYRLHDRLLRAARVGVSRGGPPAPAQAPETAAEAQPEAEPAAKPAAKPVNGAGPEQPQPGAHLDTEA